MATTLELLGMPHQQALPIIIQESLKPEYVLSDFVVAGASILPNGDVRHMVTASPMKSADEGWPYQGAAAFRYHRLAFSDFFNGIDLRLKIPADESGLIDCFTHDIALLLSNIFDIVIAQSDYVNERISGTPPVPYIFKASTTSVRWKGQVPVNLYPLYDNG